MQQANLSDAELAIGLRKAAEELDLNVAPMMRRVGLNPKLLERPEGFIPWSSWSDLLELIAVEHNCLHFGLLVGAHQPAIKSGLIGQLMKLCPDIGSAIAKAQQYTTTYSQAVYWESHIDDGFVSLVRNMHQQPDSTLGQCSSMSMVQAIKAIQHLVGQDWRPTGIHFSHSAPDSNTLRRYRDFFNVPVSFSQAQDCLVFPEADLHRQLASADAELLAIVETYANNLQSELKADLNLPELVRFLIRENLSSGVCDIHFIADLLVLHPKSLQRQLKNESLTFKRILNDERHKLAQRYLSKSEVRLSEVAELLGYSEASTMSRAFKQYCGLSPQEWRGQF